MSRWPPQALRLGNGEVLDTYPGLRIGNYLYFALQAHIHASHGRAFRVQDSGLDPDWLSAVPGLRVLLASRVQEFWWRRVHIPHLFYQEHGVDFTSRDLEKFVREVLMQSPRLELAAAEKACPDLVVNVRRGDYYSDPGLRNLYGFDVVEYVTRAVAGACDGLELPWISVISDDLAWCRQNLGFLQHCATHVSFGITRQGPIEDFTAIVRAKSLVLANSTFSYWAGYTSQVLHGTHHQGVWVPDFHQANMLDGRPWQHDPSWRALPVSRL